MKITALAGGVGGAKLARGLAEILTSEELTIIVNTGDDFEHLGLKISPDLDSVIYLLAGIANPVTGWGIADDTFTTYDSLSRMGAPDWFRLGDIDLATHLTRTYLYKQGDSLTKITRNICDALSVKHLVLPMTDDPVATWIETEESGDIPFQEYFVKKRCEPKIKSVRFAGIEAAKPGERVLDSIEQSDAVIICPSNPFVSIDPILSLGEVREFVDRKLTVCVSPIIGGKAVKGPLAKMFLEMGSQPSPQSVVDHYGGLVDCLIVDSSDISGEMLNNGSSIIFHAADILIPDKSNQIRLALDIIKLVEKYK